MSMTKFDSLPWIEKVATKQFSPFVVTFTDKWARCPLLRIVATSRCTGRCRDHKHVARDTNALQLVTEECHEWDKRWTSFSSEWVSFPWVSSCRFARESFFVHRWATLPLSLDRDPFFKSQRGNLRHSSQQRCNFSLYVHMDCFKSPGFNPLHNARLRNFLQLHLEKICFSALIPMEFYLLNAYFPEDVLTENMWFTVCTCK